MLLIELIEGGYRISVTSRRWTWWVYPNELEIRNNGKRYELTRPPVAPRLTLPTDWTLGDVVDAIVLQINDDTSHDSYK